MTVHLRQFQLFGNPSPRYLIRRPNETWERYTPEGRYCPEQLFTCSSEQLKELGELIGKELGLCAKPSGRD